MVCLPSERDGTGRESHDARRHREHHRGSQGNGSRPEATNSLDAKNERAIVENLEKFYRGRTVVVVAHRLSTVRNADQIIVLDDGKVVETGNHASLTEQKGVYYNLVKNQLELGN